MRDIARFYALLGELGDRIGGPRTLSVGTGRDGWPERGVYFFFEPGELRTSSGSGLRVVRIGTHALTPSSKTSLWDRLSQHRGVARSGAGNHRGSIFRLLVGEALIRRHSWICRTWGVGGSRTDASKKLAATPEEIGSSELPVELAVSDVIRAMPFLWLAADDPPGPCSTRAVIERNAIALLSNCSGTRIDPPSRAWLGAYSARVRVRQSGLWNNNHVDETYDPEFLDVLARAVAASPRIETLPCISSATR